MDRPSDRRRHTRFVLPSMYTSIEVRRADREEFDLAGHAYDISGGGCRFELDDVIEPGTRIAIRLQLPGANELRVSERKPVYVFANVVWVEEEDLEHAGPVRMAAVFSRFVMPGDEERLMRRLKSGRFSHAA
ncbi:MAG: PilZ domain-containing protein [Planctomycetota bacterium]